MIVEKIKEKLEQKIKESEPILLEKIKSEYSVSFLTETRKDVFDDGHPFDRSGVLMDTGEIFKDEYSNFLDFLEAAYNGNSSPTFMSGCGLRYDTYKDEIEESVREWLYKELENVVDEFVECGLLTREENDGAFDMIEKYDEHCEIEDFLWDKEHEFLSKLSHIQMEEIIKIGHSTMMPEERKQYHKLRDADHVIQKIKDLSNTKIVTVCCDEKSNVFEIDNEGEVFGGIRRADCTYQKELLNMLMEDDISVIVRNITKLEKNGAPLEVVYGFKKINGIFNSLPKELVEQAFDNKLPNEIFKQMDL